MKTTKQYLNLFVVGLLFLIVPLCNAVEITKSTNDKRTYRGLVLDNGMKVILVHDKDADRAAAALNVAVGAMQDPQDRLGLAHFLEHMLFLGTEKYPDVEDYTKYLSENGGMHNARTNPINTQYYFSVLTSGFEGALDRFSQFFIAPLFNPEYVDRERNAVNSEYLLKMPEDSRRISAVFMRTANPEHPFSRFTVGNLETLKDDVNAPTLRDNLIEFYNNFYTADRMTLSIVSSFSLDKQEELVRKYFSSITKKKAASNTIDLLPFRKSDLGKEIQIKTLTEHQEILMFFPIPSQLKNYKNKSAEFIQYLLNQTDKGSLYYELKEKNWILSMNVYLDSLAKNQDAFIIEYVLTKIGLEYINEVVQYTNNYLDFIKSQKPRKDLYADLQNASQRNFKFQEKSEQTDYANLLPPIMQDYPLEDVLTVSVFDKNTKFNEQKITEILDFLTIENMRLFIINNNIQGDLKEKYYDVDYSISDFTTGQKDLWHSKVEGLNFSMPTASSLLPKNLSMRKPDRKNSDTPVKIIDDDGVRVWFQQDLSFGLPEVNINLLFKHPAPANTIKKSIIQSLLVTALADKLSEKSIEFNLSGISVSVDGVNQGLVFNISMFSDKHNELLNIIVDAIKNITIKPLRFASYRDQLIQSLNNFSLELPFIQARSYITSLLYDNNWTTEQLLSEINDITIAEVNNYVDNFKRNTHLEGLIHGNITRDEAIDLLRAAAKRISVNESIPADKMAKPQKFLRIKPGHKYHYPFESRHPDFALLSYFQYYNPGDRNVALNLLLNSVLDAPLYQQLRTDEQLGYVVGSTVITDKYMPGIAFIIESTERDAAYLDIRLNDFIKNYYQKIIDMSNDELEKYKDALSAMLLAKDNSLTERTIKYWNEIIKERYKFTYRSDLSKVVQSLSQKDLVEFYKKLLIDEAHRQAIAVHTKTDGSEFIYGETIKELSEFKKISSYK